MDNKLNHFIYFIIFFLFFFYFILYHFYFKILIMQKILNRNRKKKNYNSKSI